MDAERPASPRSLPPSIGRYRIQGRLGKGAMGVVYSGYDDMMERSVAIKVMMADLEEDPETSVRFYREARSAGQLAHPNVITIFDMGEDNGRLFIVMELLEGETLNKYLERPEAADVESKIDLMIQICEGLAAAHSRGIFHRDVKPGNLLVRPNGDLKIVDFGIARLASSNMTASGLIFGTPDYMSPEQACGHEVDQRSDIFSSGAVFYLMLTGRKPFAAPDLTAVLAKVQSEDPLPIRETEAPAPLARLVMKALSKNPDGRDQSCGHMAAELERLKRDLEIEARQWIGDCNQRLPLLESLANQRRTLIDALDVVPAPPDLEGSRVTLLGDRASLTEPYRRSAVADLLAGIEKVHTAAVEDVDKWQRALKAVEDGSRAVAAGRAREAIAHLELALRIEPASKRASAEADRCRRTIAEQRAIDDRAKALLDEARKAAAAKHWQAAIVLCNDALTLDSPAEEATALKRKALEAIEAEARERGVECERALGRAETHRRKKRFQEAILELERARGFSPNATELHLFEERLRASIAQAERGTQVAQEAAQAIAAARQAFSSGQPDRAIADLRSFQARAPETAIAAEISRLEAEAKRMAAAERRAAEAAVHANAAETALAAGNSQQALELATRALAIDPGHLLARKVSGLAGAEVRQQAETKARAATAAQRIEEAKQQMARGKFQKARALVAAAADLNPASSQHKLVFAWIQEEEARVAAEAERQRLAKQRAKAVAPILDRARAAEAQRDYERAAWTAENALALDLDCAEAKEILRRAREQLQAQPELADETVDLTNGAGRSGDPDDTVSLTRPIGLWGRVTDVFRRWTQREGTVAREEKRQTDESQRVKTLPGLLRGKHVAKLLIFRGEAMHAQVELTGQTVRIGRSPQDEIVLEDPGRGVSRTHAEIRFEGGRYVLVDNQSQNGIWVSGSRVSSVVLEPDVVASVGPFRLMIEAPVKAGAVRATDMQTEVIPRLDQPTGPLLEDGGRVPEEPAPRPRVADAPKVRRWYEQPRTWVVTGAAASLIAASGFAVYMLLQKQRPTFDLAVARAMVDGGNCQQAVVEHIDPALRANPNDATALELRRRCTTPPPAPEPPVVPPPPTATQQLDEAETLIAAKDCPKALDKINEVLATDPNNERAKVLAAGANACITPPPRVPRVPTDPLAVRRPPSEGGLEPLPKELEEDYQSRMLAMRARYDNAVSMLQKNRYVQAAREFEQIAKQVPDGYLELAQRLDAARNVIKDEAKKSFDAAQAAENRGDFDAATDGYLRARELDPGIQIDERVRRIADQKLLLGRRKCSEGQLDFSYGTNPAAAIAAFQEVIKLLPPSEPCYAIARDRLKQLGK